MALVGATVLLGSLSACSSDKPDTAQKNTESIESASFDWDLAFAKCMRAEGIDYADPTPGGGTQQDKVDDQEAYLAAGAKCEKDITSDRGEKPRTEAEKKQRAEWSEQYSKEADCLRKKGYEINDIEGGGWGTEGDISDADVKECQGGTESQTIDGAS